MPTKHPRISVTRDPELAEAIERSRPWLDGAPDATIVHDLALRGAEALAADEQKRREAIERLIAWSLGDEMDRDALKEVKRVAWRH